MGQILGLCEIDETLHNLDHVHYHVHWIRTKGKTKSDLGIITSVDKMSTNKLILRSDLNSLVGRIILQNPGTKRTILDKANALQTGTILGFVSDKKLPSANVTCTRTFSKN